MLLTKEKFWKRLDSKQLDPLYLLSGQEEYLISDGIKRIKDLCSEGKENNLQYQYLFSDEVGLDKLMELVYTFSFISSKRLISYKFVKKPTISDREFIATLVERPPEDTTIIFICNEVDFTTAIFKFIRDNVVTVRFYPLFENQIPEWIQRECSRLGFKISPSAAKLLIELVGQDLSLLLNEIEKMCIYSPKKNIDVKDVEKAVGKSRIFSVFELTKSLGERNPVKSLNLLKQLIDSGQSPIGIIALIALHFRRIYMIRSLIEQGKNQAEISKQLGLSPFFIREYLQQANLFRRKEIKRFFEIFLEADVKLKTSTLSQGTIIECLIFKICNPADA